MKHLLTMKNVSLVYHTPDGETPAVAGLDLEVNEGEFLAVIGPSGCGKSTVLNLMAGLIPQSDGEILLGGNEIRGRTDKLGYMLQRDELFPWRTIKKNVLLPLEIKKNKSKDAEQYVLTLLQKYGLGDFLKHYPDQLSGGMRQRVALIRTLAAKPDLLLLDEPFSALDAQTRLSVCNDVFEIIRKENKTAVLVTHDVAEAVSVADRIAVLSNRPARIKRLYQTDFTKEQSPLSRREDKRFAKWFELLWRDLNDEG